MKKDIEKHIWRCLSCGARIKALGTVMPKPKECPRPKCNGKDFD